MSDEPDYILNVRGLDAPDPMDEAYVAPDEEGELSRPPDGPTRPADAPSHSGTGSSSGLADGSQPSRPWIGIRFDCCGVYQRVYRDPEVPEYVGRCPRCSRPVRVRVGPGGTRHRFFVAE